MTPFESSADDVDLLIIGSGIMGSSVARLTREAHPTARILMIDGAPDVGTVPGLHLHDSPDPEVWSRYNSRVSSGIQAMYAGADLAAGFDDIASAEPGIYRLAGFGEETRSMPAAALSWNVGGMGVHWTAATPSPAGAECFVDGDARQWSIDLDTAQRVLEVDPAAIGPTIVGTEVLRVLNEQIAEGSRSAQTMPMAVHAESDGSSLRTGPSRIFPPMARGDDALFGLLSNTLAVELLHSDGRVRGALVRDPRDGSERELSARITVVCADALRTPQLLFASGIRPPALGRHLNEHAFITSRVLIDLDRMGLTLDRLPRARSGEFATDALWLPHDGARQPFHGQLTGTVFADDDDRPLAYSLGISIYSPVESSPRNRLAFSDTRTDAFGLPRLSVEFEYSAADLTLIERAKVVSERIARLFGDFDPATELAVLPPGSSLHQTGTVRSGPLDDGTSVCDPSGRVWGFDNLYLAGNGVIPTSVVCNATLTGVVTAVRAARSISTQLADEPARRRQSPRVSA